MQEINDKLIDIELSFGEGVFIDVFMDKNNKTLAETLTSLRYTSLSATVHSKYSDNLDWGLGKFILYLKEKKDPFYKEFLNKYGDLEYSLFYITDEEDYSLKGVYFYYIHDELKYIGRCKDSMRKRVNNGYGKISPKNCFIDGQSTNCKVNALVTQYKESVKLKIYPMSDNQEIEEFESRLIDELMPEWNGRR